MAWNKFGKIAASALKSESVNAKGVDAFVRLASKRDRQWDTELQPLAQAIRSNPDSTIPQLKKLGSKRAYRYDSELQAVLAMFESDSSEDVLSADDLEQVESFINDAGEDGVSGEDILTFLLSELDVSEEDLESAMAQITAALELETSGEAFDDEDDEDGESDEVDEAEDPISAGYEILVGRRGAASSTKRFKNKTAAEKWVDKNHEKYDDIRFPSPGEEKRSHFDVR